MLYKTNCGKYSLRLNPPMTGLLILSSVGGAYTDRITLGPASHDQVGQYNVELIVEQLSANGDGYFLPDRGFLQPISYKFKVTVNPCLLTSI